MTTLTVVGKKISDGPGESKMVEYSLADSKGNTIASYSSSVGPHEGMTYAEAIDDAIAQEKARVEESLA